MSARNPSTRVDITRASIQRMRGPKVPVDPNQPLAVLREWEPACKAIANRSTSRFADVLSVFLAGAECAFRCTMCDLWKHTLDRPTPRGALVSQLRRALWRDALCGADGEGIESEEMATRCAESVALPRPRWVKLYNSSNFFDPRCVPREDWDGIAACVERFDRVVVENHPRLTDGGIAEFAGRLGGSLEVAMGLETVNEESLRLLNKQMTLADFERAAEILQRSSVDLRVFILLQPPGTKADEAIQWVMQSLRFAHHCRARHCSVIATRGGNGVMDSLAADGLFASPSASCLEQTLACAMEAALQLVITADLWDWDRLTGQCDRCREPRRRRMLAMNLLQTVLPPAEIDCTCQEKSYHE